MDQQALRAYLVVKILSKNQDDLEEHTGYGCIPKSWVKARDHYDNIVVFGYPTEDRIDTKLRIIENQPLDTSWPTIFGEVVFQTDSQEEAFNILDIRTQQEIMKQKDQSEDPNKSKQGDTEVKLPTVKPFDQPKRKRGSPRKRKLSDQEAKSQNENNGNEMDKELESEILQTEKLIRTYASDFDDDEVVSSMLKSSDNVKAPDRTHIISSETSEEETPVNKQIARKISHRPRRKSTRRTRNISEGYQGFSDENFDRSDDSDYTPELVRPDHQDNRQKHPRSSGQTVPDLDQGININLLNNQVYSECYKFYVEFNESYQKSISILDNAEAYLQKVITAHKDITTVTGKQTLPPPPSQPPYALNPNMFSHPQPLLQERCTSSISEEDTRKTLRYPEPGLGIIELMPNTGVFVSKEGLEKCQSNYKETTKFTRALLEEVFTDEALRKCSFTGVSRRKITKNPKKTPKPGLDPNARETFFDYVLNYSLSMGWKKANPKIIMSCIKNRLQFLSRIGSLPD